MSTTFNFPANPNVGDFFTLPNGTIAQWNGSEWVSVAEGAVTYPLPIALGGTGHNTAAGARVNLGLDSAAGQRQFPDGTAAAPGAAWASELGLGWYRYGAGEVRMAAGGTARFAFIGSAAQSNFHVRPGAAGTATSLTIGNQPFGTANSQSLTLWMDTTTVHIVSDKFGSAANLPVMFEGAPTWTFTNPVSVPAFTCDSTCTIKGILEVGPVAGTADALIDFKNAAGDDFDFRLGQYGATPGWFRFAHIYGGAITRFKFEGSGSGLVFDNVDTQSGSNVVAFGWRGDGQLGLRVDTTQFGSTWPISITGRSGSTGWADSAGNSDTVDGCHADSVKNFGFASNHMRQPYMRATNDAVQLLVINKGDIHGLALEGATGRLITYNVNDTPGIWIQGNWVSDIRMKRDIAPSTHDACADVRAIEFITFNYDPEKTPLDPTIRYDIGFSGQNLRDISTQYVQDMDGVISPNDQTLIPMLGKALQEILMVVDDLAGRVAALEALGAR